MNTLYMKILAYEEESGSLLVSFASDKTSSQNPEDYPSFAFQPNVMWPEVRDVQEIKRRIAIAGIWHAEQQAKMEQCKKDTAWAESLRALTGFVGDFTVDALVPETLIASV